MKCEWGGSPSRAICTENLSLFGNVLMSVCVCVWDSSGIKEHLNRNACHPWKANPVCCSCQRNGKTVGGGILFIEKNTSKWVAWWYYWREEEVVDDREEAAKVEQGAGGGEIFAYTGKNCSIIKHTRRVSQIQPLQTITFPWGQQSRDWIPTKIEGHSVKVTIRSFWDECAEVCVCQLAQSKVAYLTWPLEGNSCDKRCWGSEQLLKGLLVRKHQRQVRGSILKLSGEFQWLSATVVTWVSGKPHNSYDALLCSPETSTLPTKTVSRQKNQKQDKWH